MAVGSALVGGLVFAVAMLVVAAVSPYCCIDPRSVAGVEFILETSGAGLVAGLATSKVAGPLAAGAGVLLAVGVLVFGLLVSPGDWQLERFTLVFVAPFAVLLGAAVGKRRGGAPPATSSAAT